MKHALKSLVATVLLLVFVLYHTKAQMTAQDGRTYKTVKIGDQEWMAENLNVSTYSNGDSILYKQAKGKKNGFQTNVGWSTMTKGAWCYYETENGMDSTYGKLYNWYAVHDPRGLAPKGWHVASVKEWEQLGQFLGLKDVAGAKLKSTTGWDDNGNGTNESGFNALPNGLRTDAGVFGSKGKEGVWWTSTKIMGAYAYFCSLTAANSAFNYVHNPNSNNTNGIFGFSVRCIKD